MELFSLNLIQNSQALDSTRADAIRTWVVPKSYRFNNASELLVSIGIFNEQIMNSAVFAFKRYGDASLSYTGLKRHEELLIGGWNTKVSREEFVNIR